MELNVLLGIAVGLILFMYGIESFSREIQQCAFSFRVCDFYFAMAQKNCEISIQNWKIKSNYTLHFLVT